MIKRSPAPEGRGVKVSFILPRDGDRVSVVGDFNDWDPFAHPLRPRSNGTRSVALMLPAGGRYAFRYLAEGGRWQDDADTVVSYLVAGQRGKRLAKALQQFQAAAAACRRAR